MAGLVPERRTGEELQQANDKLLERHKAHLRAWVSDKNTASESAAKAGRSEATQAASSPKKG